MTYTANGRRLTDDVAALLARYGDTLLLELSYKSPRFPRATTNDKPFRDDFPYLADPWPDSSPPPGPVLSSGNKTKLRMILGVSALILVVLLVLAIFEVLHIYHRLFPKRPLQSR